MSGKLRLHQQLTRKQVKKYAATLTEEEVRGAVDELVKCGLEPVIAGSDLETCMRVSIFDNPRLREFVILASLEDDPVWSYAITKYVFEHGFPRFATVETLNAHLTRLTEEKYGG